MASKAFMGQLQNAYHMLEHKQQEIKAILSGSPCEIRSGWFNGHYQKDADGQWKRNAYPIPEVDVIDLCDIEIHFERITITTKLKRSDALACAFDCLMAYEFEAYGVKDYLADFYHPGQTVEEMKNKIRACDEADIGLSFSFPFNIEGEQILEFVKLLRREGFFY